MKDGLIWTGQRPMSDTGEVLKGRFASPQYMKNKFKMLWLSWFVSFFIYICVDIIKTLSVMVKMLNISKQLHF